MRGLKPLRALALLAATALGLGLGNVARAQLTAPGELELADVLEIVVLERELLAIDARGGGQTRVALELGETVLSSNARGRVGVVVTDRRLLAVSTASAAWQQTQWRRREAPSEDVQLGTRVAIATTAERVIGFDGRSGNLVEQGLGPQGSVRRVGVGENVAVVITDRSAIGLSAFAGGFFGIGMRLGEEIEQVSALSNLATIRTSRRILVFRAQGGSWEEKSRDLR